MVHNNLFVEPLTTDPPVEEIQAGLGLVHWHHVSSSEDPHECEVTARLDSPGLLLAHLKILRLSRLVLLASVPLELISPGTVTEPVADEVGVTSVDKHWDLLEDAWDQAVEGLHPVTLEQEVAVDVKVARVVRRDLDTKLGLYLLLVEELRDPAEGRVAQVRAVLALAAHVVHVLSSALVRAHHRVVTVDAGRDAGPDALTLVAAFNQRLAACKGVVHSSALGFPENSWPATITTSHRPVVLVLGQTISQAIADEHGLQVDVALLVRENLGGENWDVVAGI
jgi:hypothetical protein